MELSVVDNDRVEVSNLHRQFFFLDKDVGKYKADVLRDVFKAKRGIRAFRCRVQDLDLEEYRKHDIIVSALDNIEGRMHLNYVCKIVGCRFFVDVGTERYLAHAKLVSNEFSCLYCIRSLYEEERAAVCTLRHIGTLDHTNRSAVVLSLVSKAAAKDGTTEQHVLSEFNRMARLKGISLLTAFELKGILEEIRPSVAYMNSLAASLGHMLISKVISRQTIKYDFIFLSLEENFYVKKLVLEKSKDCIVCGHKLSMGSR